MFKFLILFIWVLVFLFVSADEPDYYWKDYNGVVPKDALPAGTDIYGNTMYIGQIYIYKYGLYVIPITNGSMYAEVPCYGVETDNDAIKILCTQSKYRFSWLSTAYDTLHLDTINLHLVVGGYNGKKRGKLNIGRVMHQGVLKIGLVKGYKLENAQFYFVYKKRTEQTKRYEVLIYNQHSNTTELDFDIRATAP